MHEPAQIPVVAAVIRSGGLYLVGRRPPGKRHAGLWEFPGGKVFAGESLLEAARRELSEELSMEARSLGEHRLSVRDGDSPYVIEFVDVEADGEPRPSEHSEVGWFSARDLRAMPMAPADARFVEYLLGLAGEGSA